MSDTSQHIGKYIDIKELEEFLAHVKEHHKDDILESSILLKEVSITVRRASIFEVLSFLKDDISCQFRILVDICGVDWQHVRPEDERFEVVYHLLSISKNLRIRIKVGLAKGESIPSVTGVFVGAGWYEREAYDMFGIMFEDHLDMRRILTDSNFSGHPLRKDFPLEGRVEVVYDDKQQRIINKNVDSSKIAKQHDVTSAWKGLQSNATLAEEDNLFVEQEPDELQNKEHVE